MTIKTILFLFIVIALCSCSMKKKLINELYKYEQNQFLDPNKTKNVRILHYLKQNHQLLFKNRKLCDSFILIDFFDSTIRRKSNKKIGLESYGTEYGICGDSGLIHTNTDTIKYIKYDYKKSNPLYGAAYDSIIHKKKFEYWSSGYYLEQRQIVQVITIKGRKIKIKGFNIDGNSKVVKKIDR